MKENWQLAEEKESVFPELKNPINQALLLRGINTKERKDEFLQPDYEQNTHDPFLISDMDLAVKRLLKAKDKKERVCIYGDYDADGVTSATLLKDFFDQIGITNMVYIPDKEKEGNGLNKKAVNLVIEQGAKVIVTVDCGISNYQEVKQAKKKGVETIITDHHSLPKKLPPALAIVNPKIGKDYPQKDLSGVGVTFKLVQGLASKLTDYDLEQLKWLLDLVAIGTIADCVPLLGENRTLAKFGLLVLSKTRRIGIKQIFQVGRIKIDEHNLATGEQISFQLAPRINAAGRMGHANLAFELLSLKEEKREDIIKARNLALELEDKNKNRQKVTKAIIKEVEERLLTKKDIPPIIIEWSPHWNYGLVGLVAGRIAEKYKRPTLILQEKGEVLRGSGRSIPEINFIKIFREQEDLLARFGGHAFALGGEFKKENVQELKKRLAKKIKKMLPRNNNSKLKIDAQLELNEIDEELMKELDQMEPFGESNREPIFLSEKLIVEEGRLVGNGEKHLKLLLRKTEGAGKLSAIGFSIDKEYRHLKPGDNVNLVYSLQRNVWNGQISFQARIIDIEIL